ncbi:uncharacterized protein N7483_006067 [Penicillium malachiteum]|uniref:uncharacterized protein n=1 Tax=Penicillium malachiteum TaxID=1324776 RepID=UPI002549B43D|nr:uncharacterized protein N7483_006067 [Penicillium malachiteum]KAJ5731559.1 hypothetical protein N7483_006067 [Penicillium malachiteum]
MAPTTSLQRPASAPHPQPSDLLLPIEALGYVWGKVRKLRRQNPSNTQTKEVDYDSSYEESIISKGETLCEAEHKETTEKK